MRERVRSEQARAGMVVDEPRRERRRDGRRHRDADRAADLLARVEETRSDARIGLANAGEAADHHRHEREGKADAAQ